MMRRRRGCPPQLRLRARVALDGLQRPPQLLAPFHRAVRSIRVQPRMAFKGVRSSCETWRGTRLRAVRRLDWARASCSRSSSAACAPSTVLVVDVGGGGDPSDHRRARRAPAPPGTVPAQLAVVAPQPLLALEPAAAADGRAPGGLQRGQLVRRNAAEERDARIRPRVVAPDAVAVVDLAVAAGRPHALGHRVGQGVEPYLAAPLHLAQLLRPQHRRLALDQLAAAPQVDEDRDLVRRISGSNGFSARYERVQTVADGPSFRRRKTSQRRGLRRIEQIKIDAVVNVQVSRRCFSSMRLLVVLPEPAERVAA